VTKVSDFTPKNPSCKTPTNLTFDGCSVQAQAFKCLNSPHTSCCSPVRSSTAKWSSLLEPVQGLNLKCRSISGLEPEMPVTLPCEEGGRSNAKKISLLRGLDGSTVTEIGCCRLITGTPSTLLLKKMNWIVHGLIQEAIPLAWKGQRELGFWNVTI
jgi:hypothetical protein